MIEYIDEIHTYLIDGIIVDSVTQILSLIFPNKYKNVPEWILKRKADYGTEVHKIIEMIENKEEPKISSIYVSEALKQYLNLKEKYKIEVLEQEQIVGYKDIYAGRFDMIAEIGGEQCLCDIKTTVEVDREYLSWQLSLYELAYGEKFDKLYCIWLPKGGLGKLIEINRIEKDEIERKLEEIGKDVKSRRQSKNQK